MKSCRITVFGKDVDAFDRIDRNHVEILAASFDDGGTRGHLDFSAKPLPSCGVGVSSSREEIASWLRSRLEDGSLITSTAAGSNAVQWSKIVNRELSFTPIRKLMICGGSAGNPVYATLLELIDAGRVNDLRGLAVRKDIRGLYAANQAALRHELECVMVGEIKLYVD